MLFKGLRKDKETGDIVAYELKLRRDDISCLYKDQYGVYICTYQGRIYKVDHELKLLEKEVESYESFNSKHY